MIAVSAVQRTHWQRANRTAPGTASTAPRSSRPCGQQDLACSSLRTWTTSTLNSTPQNMQSPIRNRAVNSSPQPWHWTIETVLSSGAPPPSDRVVVQIAPARCIRSSPGVFMSTSPAARLRRSGLRAAGTTSAPSARARRAVSRPIPAPAWAFALRVSQAGSGRRELTGGPCSIAESHRLALGVSAARAGRCSPGSAPPRGHNDLDVVAAGIRLSIGELCAGCLQLP